MATHMDEMIYINGSPPAPEPLARFLPPIPDQVAATWLRQMLPLGSWVLDPFGAAPRLAIEAARAGYRVIVAANNPVARFLLETQANPPSEDDLQAALARLAGARIGEQRLEPYIQALYETECDSCDAPVFAETFTWNRGESMPLARSYACPYCGHTGDFPVTEADRERTRKIAATVELHKARALERVAALDDPDRIHVAEALGVYVPRAVQALFSMINKLDTLDASEKQKSQLCALLLTTFDQTTSLWPAEGTRPRPRQLVPSSRFIERNVWKVMEKNVAFWQEAAPPVPLYFWPVVPEGVTPGSLVIFDGPVRDLISEVNQVPIAGLLAPLPRPNQAFWTLSALWSGWLWGREAVGPFKMVLRRRRYDWNWHTAALHAAFEALAGHLPAALPCLSLVAESEPGFMTAAVTAPAVAGFSFHGMAIRPQLEQAQLHWSTGASASSPQVENLETAGQQVVESLTNFLQEQGEPGTYSLLHAAALSGLAEREFPVTSAEIDQGQVVTRFNALLQQSLSFRSGFLRFGGTQQTPESGSWWLNAPQNVAPPLADRLERTIVNHLIAQPATTYAEIENVVCSIHRGLHTPDPALIEAILHSYAETNHEFVQEFRLRAEDRAQQRQDDIRSMQQALTHVGEQIGYKVSGPQPLVWNDSSNTVVFRFYFLASANVARYILDRSIPAEQNVLVLPGGRANLVMYKLQRDPRLAQAAEHGWRFLKFRQVLRLAENPILTSENFAELLELDPLTYTAPQMRLF